MKILIDADGCPVVKQSIKIAKEKNIDIFIFCDTSHIFQDNYATVITVSKGADSVDFALVNKVSTNDIIITQDYGLAAMCLSKKGIVLNENGMIFNENNIEQLLDSRHFYKNLRKSGIHSKGKSKRKENQNQEFCDTLKRIIDSINL